MAGGAVGGCNAGAMLLTWIRTSRMFISPCAPTNPSLSRYAFHPTNQCCWYLLCRVHVMTALRTVVLVQLAVQLIVFIQKEEVTAVH
jgi:hypothetical protein